MRLGFLPAHLVIAPVLIGLLLGGIIELALPVGGLAPLDLCQGVGGSPSALARHRFVLECLRGSPASITADAAEECGQLRANALRAGNFDPKKLSLSQANGYYHCLANRHGQTFQLNSEGENPRLRTPVLSDIAGRQVWMASWTIAIVGKIALLVYCVVAVRRLLHARNWRTVGNWALGAIAIATIAFVANQWFYNEYSYLFFWQILTIIPAPRAADFFGLSAFGFTFRVLLADQVALIWVGVTVIAACASLATSPRIEHVVTTDALGSAWGRRFKTLTAIFLGSSAVLVLGIASTRALFQWSVAMLAPEWASHKEIVAMSNSLLVVWGAAATLMLFAAYVPAAYCIVRQASQLARSGGRSEEEAQTWLAKYGLTVDWRAGLIRLVVALLPLLAGSFDSFSSKALG